MLLDIDNRLRRLELQLGIDEYTAGSTTTGISAGSDVSARLATLQQQSTALLSSSDWKELDELTEELSPGTALTHQKQIMAPILYRRAELLAAAAPLDANFKQVAHMLHLLAVTAHHTQSLTEQQVVQAPILQTEVSITNDPVESLSTTVTDLARRLHDASTRLDRMVHNYASLVAAVSEKLVLADEIIQLREQAK